MLASADRVEDRDGPNRERRVPMAVNPWDPTEPEGGLPLTEPHGVSRLHLLPGSASGAVETALEDTVDAMFAVVAVAAALGRYAVELGLEGPRAALRHRPVAADRPPALRNWVVGSVVRLTARPRAAAGRVVSAVADEVVPWAAREVLARVDVPALVHEYIDVDRVAAELDVDAVAARVDLDAIVDRVDIDAVIAKLDLDGIVDKVDIARVIDKVDLDGVVARVDLDRAVDRVDIARVLDKVDLDAVVERVDLDRAVGRVDVDSVAEYVIEEIDLPTIVRESSASIATETVHGIRVQSMDADQAVSRVVDRLLRRQPRHAVPPTSEPGAPS